MVLIDFGLSTAFTSNREGVCGTPGYIPPETWRRAHSVDNPCAGLKSIWARTGVWYPRGDVFSLGIVCLDHKEAAASG